MGGEREERVKEEEKEKLREGNDTPLKRYKVDLDFLEEITGFTFWPVLFEGKLVYNSLKDWLLLPFFQKN